MEEYDIKEVSKTATPKNKVQEKDLKKLKRNVTFAVATVMLVLISSVLYGFLKHTNFNTDVLLTEDISRWNTLSFTEANSIENSLGTWEKTENSYVLGDCSIRPSVGMSPAYVNNSDKYDTTALEDSLKETGTLEALGTINIPVADHDGTVQFKYAQVNSYDDYPVHVLYRGSSQTGAVYTLTLTCQENIEKTSELAELIKNPLDLGIKLHL